MSRRWFTVKTGHVALTLSLLFWACQGQSSDVSSSPRATPTAEHPKLAAANQQQAAASTSDHSADAVVGRSPGPDSTVDALKVAQRWLDALERKAKPELTSLTQTPFALHDPPDPTGCGNRVASQQEDLADLLQCLLDDGVLIDDLAFELNHPHVPEGVAANDFPRWSKRWRKEIPAGAKPVGFFIYGGGISHEIILVVEGSRVSAFWRGVKFDAH
ncbi:MAG TPA: hypothetical protein VI299_06515 [Polyangiales bacterium]